MKKITLTLAAIVAAFSLQAQTTHFSDDFNDSDISDWTLYDEDGDGLNWSAVQIQDNTGAPVGTPVMRSASWNSQVGPLNPNNYSVSPIIDLTGETGSSPITLEWVVTAADADYADENYTVYVATGNTVADIMNSTISYNEIVTDNGPGGLDNPYTKTLDITSLAGQVIYIAFRHHNVSDEFTIEIDNVKVTSNSTTAVVNDSLDSFKFYVDTNSQLNISANSAIEVVDIYNVLGQRVTTQTINNTSGTINLGSLQNGVYVGQVTIEGQTKSFKFVKK